MTASIEQAASDADAELIQTVPALLKAQPPDPAELRLALSALRRALSRPEVDDRPELQQHIEDVQASLGLLRVKARTESADRYVKTTKVRASVLRALAKGPATPSAIAQRSSRAAAVVSRALKRLREEGLVAALTDPADGRQLIYELTDAGEAVAADVVAFAEEPAREQALNQEIVCAALREALDAAVELRRRTSERKEILKRLRAIADHAQRANAYDVHVRALNEILTTLRQDGQEDAFKPALARLEAIASGEDETVPARIALGAVAHLEYQLGRHPKRSAEVKAGHLVAAHNYFRRFTDDHDALYWRECEGWAHAALADNYRQQSALDPAIACARAAMAVFEDLDDPYGLARAHFLLGFCMRLMGRFEQARQELLTAQALSDEHGYRRFGADTLMQLGEVNRCLGQIDDAWTHLVRAREQATELRLTLTGAFADSALAAVMHQRGEQNDALRSLDRAQGVFKARRFTDGLALSLRRRSVVLRERSATPANLDRAQEYVEQARQLYIDIKSPAGIAACHIEDGLLAVSRGKATRKVCILLIELCARPMMGYWIERDPWVPIMLSHFADETGHEELQKLAAVMLSRNGEITKGSASGFSVRPAKGSPGNQSAKGSTGKQPAISSSARARVYAQYLDHMGGEHRRVSADSMATAFTDDIARDDAPSEPLEIEWRFA